jgi:hypothetical protein
MTEKLFPIQTQRGAAPHPLQIPWSIAEMAYSVYASRYGRSQSLERLAERGGFGPSEMDDLLPDWRAKTDVVCKLVAAVKDLRLLCIRIARAKDDDKRAELIGHANRISKSVGIESTILREYTEGT